MIVAIIGQGYVGLPLTLMALNAGHTVLAVESGPARLASLQNGQSYIPDVPSEALGRAIDAGRLVPMADLSEATPADVYVIAVPTPITKGDAPDLTFVDGAVSTIAGVSDFPEGALVAVESTIYPGAMRQHVTPRLERATGRRAGQDVYLAYSPERVDPGRTDLALADVTKLVAGTCEESQLRAQKFYETMFRHVHAVSSCEVAEFAKLLENTFRYVNIAFVNELAMAARNADIDFREVVAAASSKPYGFMAFHHGPGVGGHCLPNNVRYLAHALEQSGVASSMLSAALEINESAPVYVADRMAKALANSGLPLAGSTVILVGLAYKAGVPDVRASPALRLIDLLQERGATVQVVDPLAAGEADRLGLTCVTPTLEDCRAADAVLIVTDQDGVDYDMIARESAIILDCRGRIKLPSVEQL
ncbi:nucleotide sugar dehydrogenase [Actinoplanes sp. NPDC051343]|uniref:nucleotide sugar dehydrogenase n=1 Tax=Actinoplanes sp. NPDC051343 TaxID=3363906 RepID=UPI00379076D7